VVDVHHKPRGLTSLSRYHLSQVHNVPHKPRKKFSWRHKQIWSKTSEFVAKWRTGHCPVHQARTQMNQPLSGIRWACSAIIHQIVWCAPDMFGVHRTCSVSQRSNGHYASTVDCKSEQWSTVRDRSQSSKVRGHRTCSVCHRTVRCSKRTKGSNSQQLQTPTDALTWRAPDSDQWLSVAPPDCLVCPSPVDSANG
jgi:hypothetical protein